MNIKEILSKKDTIIASTGKASQIRIASEFILKKKKDVFFIIDDTDNYSEYFELSQLFLDKEKIFCFPSFLTQKEDTNFFSECIKGLYFLLNNYPKLVFIPLSTFLLRFPPLESLNNYIFDIQVGDELDLDFFLQWLIDKGYTRVKQVTAKGEFALKGDILDIYSQNYVYPLRIELFGDNVEQIRFFEPLMQTSIKFSSSAEIIPFARFSSQANSKLVHLKKTGELTSLEEGKGFWGLCFENSQSLLSYSQNKILFIPQSESFSFNLKEKQEEVNSFCQNKKLPYIYIFFQSAELKNVLTNENKLFFPYLHTEKKYDFKLREEKFSTYEDIFWKPEEKIRPIKALKEKILQWSNEYRQIIFSFKSESAIKKFLKIFSSEQIKIKDKYNLDEKGIFVVKSNIKSGYALSWDNLLILSENILLPSKSVKIKNFKGLKNYDKLEENDLIVHRDYGLGLFKGLQTLKIDNRIKEFLLLIYANEDKLYLPVEKINLIQKYKGPEGSSPALDKLGSSNWQKSKNRVQKEVAKIAKDLVEMYAYRKVIKKFRYAPLDADYYEFEASFGFEETPDQARAIEEVLKDMDKDTPMDRLVCGDVGFGKTEVAMRAAFRAVQNGYQVCLLCPTTVLAEQHYQNFKKRMEPFGVSVEMLSRFVKPSKQKKILEQTKVGKVDILIGTHRLLSKDVIIPRLSLLILDEEQRFGVRHKDKLKQIKKEIDVLTLTATPIPRTLQLSLSGIRELSVIETPPPERKPVKTQLLERNKKVLKNILEFELTRQGQIFWVYNRVRGLSRVAEEIKKLVPQARVEIAHGQMSEKKLEEVMHRFWQKDVDILVCTSIIESGLDFPNANTLVVDNAHLFGLGQLYQLRGRVGRSEKQAFAYFLVPNLQVLPAKSKKRLQVILALDYLGAGFHLAMEDLRLRGAGNILGEAQSGNIGKVGLDLFLEMLNDEVKRLKGEKITEKVDPEIEVNVPAYIPNNYIEDEKERLHYYQRLVSNNMVKDDVLTEIKDKFGDFPEEFSNFITLINLKNTARKLKIKKINIKNTECLIKWDENSLSFDVSKIIEWLNKNSQFQFLPTGEVKILKNKDITSLEFFSKKIKELEKYLLC
ncbi:MAG: hypothetical protein PWR24_1511 [Desulfonauticus sp.]|jgi:transcription-repair coupling factor (superfamily II helicase)|nr:hypothetical protein [Desulfonauticus sp.]